MGGEIWALGLLGLYHIGACIIFVFVSWAEALPMVVVVGFYIQVIGVRFAGCGSVLTCLDYQEVRRGTEIRGVSAPDTPLLRALPHRGRDPSSLPT